MDKTFDTISFKVKQNLNSQYPHSIIILDKERELGEDLNHYEKLNLIKRTNHSSYVHLIDNEIYIFVGNEGEGRIQSHLNLSDNLTSLEKGTFSYLMNETLIQTIFEVCNNLKIDSFNIELNHPADIHRFIILMNRQNFQMDNFLSHSPKCKIKEIDIITDLKEDLEDVVHDAHVLSLSNNYGNYISALPSNICTTDYMINEIKFIASLHSNCEYDILGETHLKALNMNCLLAVGQGSAQQTYLGSLFFKNGEANDRTIVLVGKGLVFDTGGLQLKSSKGMLNMHLDMAGAASVLAIMKASILLDLKVNLIVVIPLAENACGNESIHPGSIIKSMSGKTVAITDTDAEGRLVLCDALTYIQKHHNPDIIISIATLTGCVVSALGTKCYGLFTNNSELRTQLIESAVKAGESCWPLPFLEEYNEKLKGTVSDLINVNRAEPAGSVQGAMFLKNFIEEESISFAHLDIAGICDSLQPQKKAEILPIGTIIAFLANYSFLAS